MTTNLQRLDIKINDSSFLAGPVKKTWLIIFIPFLWLACSDSEGGDDTCVDVPSPNLYLPADLEGDVELKAELSVDERIITDENGEQVILGMFQAYFSDMSDYEDELIDAIPFGAACVGEVGLHVIVSKPVAVGGGDTVFTGITGGDIALTEDDDGTFDLELVRERIFTGQGGEELQVSVAPSDREPGFGDFDLRVTVPPEVTLNEITQLSDGSIQVDWEAADTTYFEIVMTAEAAGSELPANRLRCLVEDDGCHIISAGGIAWLLSQGANDVSVRLKRHVLVHDAITANNLAELDLERTLEFKFDIK